MSKGKKCLPIIAFLLFMAVGISKAEPTPTISYLMNTPVSMLDFGIYKLESRIFEMRESWAISKYKPKVRVQYNYDLKKITIRLIYFITKRDEIKDIQGIDIKQHITKVIKTLKTLGFALGDEHSSIDLFFQHVGYKLKNKPKNIGKELDQITEIYVDFFAGKNRFKCKSPLIGNKIYWENTGSKP